MVDLDRLQFKSGLPSLLGSGKSAEGYASDVDRFLDSHIYNLALERDSFDYVKANFSSAAPPAASANEVTHGAAEDFEEFDGLRNVGSNSVIEEARFMQALGNKLKQTFSGLSVQQFATPMRRMRGAGGDGWTLHNTGEAIDLFYSRNDDLTDWLVANASTYGIRVIIDYYNSRSWNSRRKAWRFSKDIDTSYHHIHIDRGGHRRNGQGLSPAETLATGVRQVVGGIQ